MLCVLYTCVREFFLFFPSLCLYLLFLSVNSLWNSCFVFCLFEPQVQFMKRIAEMSDLSHVIRTLPRIKKHLLNPDNMRWVHITVHLLISCFIIWPEYSILYSKYLTYFSLFKFKCPYRCAINATPQKMSDTSAQLESFMKDVADNRRTIKPVRTTIIEVWNQQANWTNKPVWIFVILSLLIKSKSNI